MLVRIHYNKRRALFTPKGTICPIDPSDLDYKRTTYVFFLPDHEPEVIEDE